MAGTSSKKRKKSGPARHKPRGNPQKAQQSPNPRSVEPATFADWIGAARLRTLPLAVTPVLIGTGAAMLVTDELHWVIALACLVVAVALQIGVNYANDYSDGVRGTDDHRVGPARLTASRKAKPRTVLIVAFAFFGIAALAGLAITIRTEQWWLIAVGAVCIVAAWFYTGGKRPYGYAGLGELFVFVFFGLVATLGTTWVQALSLPQEAWFGAVGAGFIACAVLLANNLRDISQDRVAGKRTLTVLIGRTATRWLFTVLVLAAFVIAAWLALFYPIAWLTMLALLAALPAILIVWTYRDPRELVVALGLTSLTSVAYGAFLFWAFVG
ncbi:1,4-dihydroxy-2-naphthoate polyprenyltransferase [Microbacterium thalassium]|uniref:1,4-dihydroxy-2-naphthoate octaprenyltransferase n=1 Tax=Microbacterium thalassium TaxID=362649 RepID=A0A7X0FSK0_9MICO|nr:1,4-dihydroxy-2-naphthoate polyprenyltransferase [Microbacterium thalassium]MBB6392937.1 1,4-dihydroxy-2-naphthoate octaprenyltransferase [Microbacterium thalassium]GLK22832.1 1,4-dihydroxy-2-naphthoate octaprenyltransferase [Microbacterium thalassium]